MSVKHIPDNKLRVVCDGRTTQGPCANEYTLLNDASAMAAANEWLQRRGWRTKIDGYVQLHFCVYCQAKVPEFSPRMKADDPGPTKRVRMSAETKRKLSDRAVEREERKRESVEA